MPNAARLPSVESTALKGTLREPGMWPEGMPGRGSGAVPSKRPGERASTITSARDATFAFICSADLTSSS